MTNLGQDSCTLSFNLIFLSDITMDLGLVDVDVEPEDILAQPGRRRTRNRNKYEKMKKDKVSRVEN